MRILVTGGAGYVGSILSARLIDAGMKVIVYDNLLYGGEGMLSLFNHQNFQFIPGDIRDSATLIKAVKKADMLVHLAALVGDAACGVDPKATVEINTDAVKQLVFLASKYRLKRLVFSSTCSNYGLIEDQTIANEDAGLRPLSLYAQTKVDAERIIVAACQKGLVSCILRFGTIYGLSPRMRFDLLVNDIARSAALGKKITFFSPHAWRPFVHIGDAAEAIYVCLTASSQSINGQIFNVVGENYQKRQLSQLVKKHFPQVPVSIKMKKRDPRDYRVSAKRIAERLGFRPKHTVEEAFLEMAHAVRSGIFSDPFNSNYETIPKKKQLEAHDIGTSRKYSG